MDFIFSDYLFQNSGIGSSEPVSPVGMYPSFVAVPGGTHSQLKSRGICNSHFNAVGIFAQKIILDRSIKNTFSRINAAARYFNRTSMFKTCAPVCYIYMMTCPISQLATGIIKYPAPVPM
jgi:hypothetical protein